MEIMEIMEISTLINRIKKHSSIFGGMRDVLRYPHYLHPMLTNRQNPPFYEMEFREITSCHPHLWIKPMAGHGLSQ
jgi:hypothetical protein